MTGNLKTLNNFFCSYFGKFSMTDTTKGLDKLVCGVDIV